MKSGTVSVNGSIDASKLGPVGASFDPGTKSTRPPKLPGYDLAVEQL